MRGTQDKCGTCKFLQGGECHRNPPFLMIIGEAYGKQRYKAVWPTIEDIGNWCGEYRAVNAVEVTSSSFDIQYIPMIDQDG